MRTAKVRTCPPADAGRKLEAPLSQVNPMICASRMLFLITFSGIMQCDDAVQQNCPRFGHEKQGTGIRFGLESSAKLALPKFLFYALQAQVRATARSPVTKRARQTIAEPSVG
ncbi:hypothetical protein PbB2_00682 [Candidatus Phycosocius bacilliformis]|uniref:Uncharacterized protein n=1 Tax=Candidatus Phycosocius bacilliformis TaxID=1445552 RepID=A0A2P2E7K3_9PROT|nr:hypothetical protein PbB2_00682 [Candidatus Phycosocius bacilliformis]